MRRVERINFGREKCKLIDLFLKPMGTGLVFSIYYIILCALMFCGHGGYQGVVKWPTHTQDFMSSCN